LKAFVVEEANHIFGESLGSDLELQTTLHVCAVCSELKSAGELICHVGEE
jgi:hypothetical protein